MTLKELEERVAELPSDQMAKFREWFLKFDAEKFDERIERDAHEGRLDQLANEALRQHAAGESRPL